MGACVTRIRELDLLADSFTDELQPGEVKFYSIELTREFLQRRRDLVVRCHVQSGSVCAKADGKCVLAVCRHVLTSLLLSRCNSVDWPACI